MQFFKLPWSNSAEQLTKLHNLAIKLPGFKRLRADSSSFLVNNTAVYFSLLYIICVLPKGSLQQLHDVFDAIKRKIDWSWKPVRSRINKWLSECTFACNIKILKPFHIVLWSLSTANQGQCLKSDLNSELTTHGVILSLLGNCIFVLFFNILFFNRYTVSSPQHCHVHNKICKKVSEVLLRISSIRSMHSSGAATDFQSGSLEELQGNGWLFFSPRRFTFSPTSQWAGGRENNEDWQGRKIVRVGVRDGKWELWKRGRKWNRGANLAARTGT